VYHLEYIGCDFPAWSAKMVEVLKSITGTGVSGELLKDIYEAAGQMIDEFTKSLATVPEEHRAQLVQLVRKSADDGNSFSAVLARLKDEGLESYGDAAKGVWDTEIRTLPRDKRPS
jgi:hypothetical protein